MAHTATRAVTRAATRAATPAPAADLAELEAVSQRITARAKEQAADAALRDQLIVAARKANYTWLRIRAAARMSEPGINQAARRANGGLLPQPQNR